MTLYVKDSGSWETATEVYIKKDSVWTRCKEVYIKENGQWKSLLFEAATQSITTTGTGSFDVPQGAYRAIVTIAGGNGGRGGDDTHTPGSGGKGAELTIVLDVEPFTTFTYDIGQAGGDGVDGRGSAAGGTGGSGYSSGGNGGQAGPYGSSGGGGAGGGSTAITDPDGNLLVIAAGGGGGGGAGNEHYMGSSVVNGKNATYISDGYDGNIFVGDPTAGEQGRDCQAADGGAGGGAGAGVKRDLSEPGWPNNVRGAYAGLYAAETRCGPGCFTDWAHYDSDGQGGQGGFSYYNRDFVKDVDTGLNTGTDGSINITWLQDRF